MTVKRVSKGFTLVEILIVVVILGILAAIVIPQFTNASESARSSSLISQLQTIRSQLELFQVQHGGTYPTLGAGAAADWSILTAKSNQNETVAPAVGTTYGPYLQQPPHNPFEDSTSIAAAPAAGVGWVYSQANGTMKACMKKATADNLKLDEVNDVATY
jgi:general secretion pathway protein G